MKLLFLTNVPSPYRVDFFNELGKKCDLTVLFEKRTSDERDKSWKNYKFDSFRGVFLNGKSISADTAICVGVINYIKDRSYDYIICSNFSSPTGMIAIQYMKIHHIDYCIEADGGTAKSGHGLKERIKRHFISGAERYFSTSKSCDDYFVTYGADTNRIYRYPFTSLKSKDIFEKIINSADKKEIRAQLGMKETYIVVSVGRFSYLNGYGKGYDAILRAAAQLKEIDIGWYIIGGEPSADFIKMTADMQLTNVHYIDFKVKEDLKAYYRAADLFVLMTIGEAWGLVINEAMSCGLPVITTDKCVAGVELVENEENGYIISVGDDCALAQHTANIIRNPAEIKSMGEKSLKRIKDYTIEKMADRHYEIFLEDNT